MQMELNRGRSCLLPGSYNRDDPAVGKAFNVEILAILTQ